MFGAPRGRCLRPGAWVDTVPTAPGTIVSPTYLATVTDGVLTLELTGVQDTINGVATDGLAYIEGLTCLRSCCPTVDSNRRLWARGQTRMRSIRRAPLGPSPENPASQVTQTGSPACPNAAEGIRVAFLQTRARS